MSLTTIIPSVKEKLLKGVKIPLSSIEDERRGCRERMGEKVERIKKYQLLVTK